MRHLHPTTSSLSLQPACLQIVSQNRLAPIRRYAGAWPGGAHTPIRRYPDPGRKYADTPIRRYADTPIRAGNTPIRRYRSKYADTPIQEANTPIRRSGQGGWHGVSVYRCGPPPPSPPPPPAPRMEPGTDGAPLIFKSELLPPWNSEDGAWD